MEHEPYALLLPDLAHIGKGGNIPAGSIRIHNTRWSSASQKDHSYMKYNSPLPYLLLVGLGNVTLQTQLVP